MCCAFSHLLSSAPCPTLVRNSGIAKTATFGSSAERRKRRYPEAAIFLGYQIHFYVANCGAKCLPSSGIESLQLRTKPATCNASAEQTSKDSPWRSFLIDRIYQGRIWYAHTNKIRCYGKVRGYETISNKSVGKSEAPGQRRNHMQQYGRGHDCTRLLLSASLLHPTTCKAARMRRAPLEHPTKVNTCYSKDKSKHHVIWTLTGSVVRHAQLFIFDQTLCLTM